MVLRECTVCGRKFTKTEHFKRHERSHTRERPYSCSVCQKAFSRSDVLFRHMKCHTQKDDEQSPATRRNTISEGVKPSVAHAGVYGTALDSPSNFNSSHPGIPLNQILSPSNYPANEPQQPRTHSLDANNSYLHSQSTPGHGAALQMPGASWPSASNGAAKSHSRNSAEASTFETAITTPGQGQTPRTEIMTNNFGPTGLEWLQQTNGDGAFHNSFQMWLFPSLDDLELDQSPDIVQSYGLTDQTQFQHPKDLANGTSTEAAIRTKNINKVPRDRFSRVQRCWNPRPGRTHRIIPTLWKELASADGDNLFSDGPTDGSDFRTSSNWGLDAECRLRLRNAFRTPAPSTFQSPRLQPIVDPSSAQDLSEFPPAEILDIALGLFFRRFHPTVPFIHVATFSVRSTSSPMLFAMCLIGLSILGTTGATRFVARMFPSFLQRVSSEMSVCAGGSAPGPQQMTIFATALLTLNLSIMTGDKDAFNQSQMLYVSLLSIVQQNGLLAAGDGASLDALLAEMSESDDRWKAWSRIESAKRLILGLLLLDSWYSNLLSRCPVVRSESVCLVAPCDEVLFQAKSATQWQSMLRSGKLLSAPAFRIEDLHRHDLTTIGDLGALGRSTLLALLQIQILEAYQRLMPPDQLTVGSFVPWHVYAGDARARSVTPALLAAAYTAGPLAGADDTNSKVLWHSLCVMLLSDFRMFELAAGRHGPAPATAALENISQWSQTLAARRACIHAAQVFKLMSERRVSDNVTIHSVTALFASALVLGLYLFMVGTRQGTAPVELTDAEPDWRELGDIGFRDDSLDNQRERVLTTNREDEQNFSLMYQFVKYGGTVCLNGVTHHGGYESARRVLLDFANLMDGISGRRLRFFTQVLHIMSDDLMNVDPAL